MRDEEPDELASWRGRLARPDDLLDMAELPSDGRARLLAAVSPIGRFDRFAPGVAALADVSEAQAKAWLDQVWTGGHWEPATPGSTAWWVPGGPRTANALRGFVHIPAGVVLDHHTHLGDEHVLVIQGRANVSTGETLVAGDAVVTHAGASHSFVVPRGGPDLLLFTVAYEGLEFATVVARPRD